MLANERIERSKIRSDGSAFSSKEISKFLHTNDGKEGREERYNNLSGSAEFSNFSGSNSSGTNSVLSRNSFVGSRSRSISVTDSINDNNNNNNNERNINDNNNNINGNNNNNNHSSNNNNNNGNNYNNIDNSHSSNYNNNNNNSRGTTTGSNCHYTFPSSVHKENSNNNNNNSNSYSNNNKSNNNNNNNNDNNTANLSLKSIMKSRLMKQGPNDRTIKNEKYERLEKSEKFSNTVPPTLSLAALQSTNSAWSSRSRSAQSHEAITLSLSNPTLNATSLAARNRFPVRNTCHLDSEVS